MTFVPRNSASPFQPFELEQFMSENEQDVEYVFAESGVHPMTLDELLPSAEQQQDLMGTLINYPEVNGTKELRRTIGALYGEDNIDKVLVTVGASEANFTLAQTLLEPGDEVAMLRPTYLQFWGNAKNLGAEVREFYLVEDKGWALDLESLEKAVTPATKVIALVNPNNPTGYILTEAEMDAIIAAAARVGAWIVADEVYAGAERLTDTETPSFYGRYDKVLAIGSMSKAYGLPGLRLGWAVGPQDIITQAWRHHEYVTISSTMLSNRLALEALSAETRPRILARTRGLIREGWPLLEALIEEHSDLLSVVPPQASAMSFLRYNLKMGSVELAKRLKEEKSILAIPGAYFAQEHHLRFSFALHHDVLREGLTRLADLLVEVREEEAAQS
ncbi:aminotransferase class I/II-fold pyridoxal phosphate-dependent enzyme [Rhodovibrionaceae bacterium A322]